MQARFEDALARSGALGLRRAPVRTLQVNVGRRCDLACHHCHVEAGPKRSETPRRARRGARARAARRAARGRDARPDRRRARAARPSSADLVRGARALGREVIDRCNLTVLFEPGQEDTAEFLAAAGVKIVASLPCYGAENVDRQRGRGVFERSIEALRLLNDAGLRACGLAPRTRPRLQPAGPVAAAGRARRSRRATARSCASTSASSSTAWRRSPTCRSSASRTRSSATASTRPTWRCWSTTSTPRRFPR